jgi:hypothetical protein
VWRNPHAEHAAARNRTTCDAHGADVDECAAAGQSYAFGHAHDLDASAIRQRRPAIAGSIMGRTAARTDADAAEKDRGAS